MTAVMCVRYSGFQPSEYLLVRYLLAEHSWVKPSPIKLVMGACLLPPDSPFLSPVTGGCCSLETSRRCWAACT